MSSLEKKKSIVKAVHNDNTRLLYSFIALCFARTANDRVIRQETPMYFTFAVHENGCNKFIDRIFCYLFWSLDFFHHGTFELLANTLKSDE